MTTIAAQVVILAVFVSACQCVKENKNPRLIVGGEQAERGQFPYIVSMQNGKRHFCGGSILNEMVILTAAHCISDRLDVMKWKDNHTYFTV